PPARAPRPIDRLRAREWRSAAVEWEGVARRYTECDVGRKPQAERDSRRAAAASRVGSRDRSVADSRAPESDACRTLACGRREFEQRLQTVWARIQEVNEGVRFNPLPAIEVLNRQGVKFVIVGGIAAMVLGS